MIFEFEVNLLTFSIRFPHLTCWLPMCVVIHLSDQCSMPVKHTMAAWRQHNCNYLPFPRSAAVLASVWCSNWWGLCIWH